jgi:hypothetical protein
LVSAETPNQVISETDVVMTIRTCVFLLFAIPVVAIAQTRTTAPSLTPNQLTPAEFDRLYTRAMGTWQLNKNKSTIFSGDNLGVPNGYIYAPTEDRRGVKFTSASGTSVQQWDGKAYGEGTTIARAPIDEFTIDNVVSRNGRRTARNTQVYAPDGKRVGYIVRRVDEQGHETIVSIVIFERVPEGTEIFGSAPRP